MSKQKRTLIRIVAAAIWFLLVILFENVFGLALPMQLVLYILLYAFVGFDIVWEAIGGIGRGQIFDENFLMVLATVGAFATGAYPEAVAVMLLYQIGELFQSYAVGKSRNSISDLMNLRPDTACVLRNGNEEIVLPEEVQPGEIIVVKPGERVPLDGTVCRGSGALDTSALTGESVPRVCNPGDSVLSGSISTNSVLEICVEKEFYDSTISRILDMVENVSGKKAKTERFITRFARYYTPIVVCAALIMAVVPPIFDRRWVHWIRNAMNFLVVSCPCALVISVPLSFFSGIGAASRLGVLVKGSSYLERFAKTDTFVFDKTGTLTKGVFEVTEVISVCDNADVLHTAAIAEQGSLHPIAQSIRIAAGDVQDVGWELTEHAGYGVMAKNDQDVILAGSRRFLQQHDIEIPEIFCNGTVVCVARNQAYLGAIVISDVVKEDAVSAVAELHSYGAELWMLSGDREAAAATIAKQLNMDEYLAELLPGDKVHAVEQLIEEKGSKGVVAFVGDGINDAPVLMRADVGIAMGGIGSDAAIEAADMVLMHDSLSALPAAMRIAKKTMRIVWQNIVFALGIKLLVLALTPFGLVSVWLAIFADVGVAILAILNAMRAGKMQKNASV